MCFLLWSTLDNCVKKQVSWEALDVPILCQWLRFLNASNVSKKQLDHLALQLCKGEFSVNGKSTFKDEFVTAGGVDLKEIDFKAFRSKKYENLYLTGEVLNIDAITGGFNFQNAWTGGFIAAKAIAGIS